jgi:hypothetical protein
VCGLRVRSQTHQAEEHGAVGHIQGHGHLIRLRRTGHVAPVRAQASRQAVGLRLQLPALVVLRPGELELIARAGRAQLRRANDVAARVTSAELPPSPEALRALTY